MMTIEEFLEGRKLWGAGSPLGGSAGVLPLVVLSILLGACSGDSEDAVRGSELNQITERTGSCVHPVLNFEKPEAWTDTHAVAPSYSSSSFQGNGALSLSPGLHFLRTRVSAHVLSLDSNSARIRVATSPGVNVSFLVRIFQEDGRDAVTTRAFRTATSTNYMTIEAPFVQQNYKEWLRREIEPVLIQVELNANAPLRVDALELGSTVCEQCTAPYETGQYVGEPPQLGINESFGIRLPVGTTIQDVALAASYGELRVNDGAMVRNGSGSGFATIAQTDGEVGATYVGVASEVGDVWSGGPLTLRSPAVRGDVHFWRLISYQQPAIVEGEFLSGPFESELAFVGYYQQPTASDLLPDVILPANSFTRTIQPGHYRRLNVGSGSRVVFEPGSYTFDSFILEPNGVVELDNQTKGYRIYVRSQLIARGTAELDPARGNVFFLYQGFNEAELQYKFPGVFVAPYGKLNLRSTNDPNAAFRGAFYGLSVELHQHSTLWFHPYAGGDCEPDVVHPCGFRKPGCPAPPLDACRATVTNSCNGETVFDPSVPSAVCYSAQKDDPVWGFADLHIHPATHLGFGARADGNSNLLESGLFHGQPEEDEIGTCNPDKHSGFTLDAVQHQTRTQLVSQLDNASGHLHRPDGPSGHGSWPSAQSVIHQQMHVDWIRRAHDGGLRLMFAAVADNHLLTKLWHTNGNLWETIFLHQAYLGPLAVIFAATGVLYNGDPGRLPGWSDRVQAAIQLRYIRDMVARNSDFMAVVTTPAEARAAIHDGKLAVVLSLEMDQLTLNEIFSLRSEFGVGQVTPIHLANNVFGGTAVYDDLFETSNMFLNDDFFRVNRSATTNYQLGGLQTLKGSIFGSVIPENAGEIELQARGACTPQAIGMVNQVGLTNPNAMRTLLRSGLMVDVSHMSEKAVDATLTLAEELGVPVHASHGGVRGGLPLSDFERTRRGGNISERALTEQQVRRIAALGGVLGIGTSGESSTKKRLATIRGGEILRIGKGGAHEIESFRWDLVDSKFYPKDTLVSGVRIETQTGLYRKEACGEAKVRIRIEPEAGGAAREEVFELGASELFHSFSWSLDEFTFAGGPVRLADLTRFELAYTPCADAIAPPGTIFQERFWTVRDLKVQLVDGAGEARGMLIQETGSIRNFNYGQLGGISARSTDPGFLQLREDEPWQKSLMRMDRCSAPGTPCVPWSDVLIDRVRVEAKGEGEDLAAQVLTQDRCETPARQGSHDSGIWTSLVPLPSAIPVTDLSDVTVAPDDRDKRIDSVRVLAIPVGVSDQEPGVELSQLSGTPWFEGSGAPSVYEAAGCTPLSLDESAELIEIEIKTGGDDLRSDSYPVLELRSRTIDGTIHVTRFELNTTEYGWGGPLQAEGKTFRKLLRLPGGTRVRDLIDFTIIGNMKNDLLSNDDWNIDSIVLSVVQDPLEAWNTGYRHMTSLMGGKGVALGTDLNGLQHQLAASSAPSAYSPSMNIKAPLGPSERNLEPSVIGERVLSLQDDGLAHVGMLPELAQTLRRLSASGDDSADRLFRSAEDTLRMWEKVEAATLPDWAARGTSQPVQRNRPLRLGKNLPTWWDLNQSPQFQLTEVTAGHNLAQNPLVLRWTRESDGSTGILVFTALWQQQTAKPLARTDRMRIEVISGPANAKITQY